MHVRRAKKATSAGGISKSIWPRMKWIRLLSVPSVRNASLPTTWPVMWHRMNASCTGVQNALSRSRIRQICTDIWRNVLENREVHIYINVLVQNGKIHCTIMQINRIKCYIFKSVSLLLYTSHIYHEYYIQDSPYAKINYHNCLIDSTPLENILLEKHTVQTRFPQYYPW